jgi:hypothetical protein
MAYRRFNRSHSKPTVRNITAKFASQCVCCGGPIKAGDWVSYYPLGTIAGISEGKVAHVGGLEGNSAKCAGIIRSSGVDHNLNDYAGDGLDARYEDDCAEACGL